MGRTYLRARHGHDLVVCRYCKEKLRHARLKHHLKHCKKKKEYDEYYTEKH